MSAFACASSTSYERLDYMHVPTYAPVLLLLLRAETLLVVFEIGKTLLPSVQSLLAVTAALLYADSFVFASCKPMRAFSIYVGGILPVAFALFTNSSTVWAKDVGSRWMNVSVRHICVDTAWICVCLAAVLAHRYVRASSASSTRPRVKSSMFFLALADSAGLLHILWLDGEYSTEVFEFAVRISLFYSCALMLYAMHGLDMRAHSHGEDAQRVTYEHKLLTLHAAFPILWAHVVIISVYLLFILVILSRTAWSSPDTETPFKESTQQKQVEFDQLQQQAEDLQPHVIKVESLPNQGFTQPSDQDVAVSKKDDDTDLLLQQLRAAQKASGMASKI